MVVEMFLKEEEIKVDQNLLPKMKPLCSDKSEHLPLKKGEVFVCWC